MPISRHVCMRRLPLVLLLAACAALPAGAQTPAEPQPVDLAAQAARLKATQIRFMMRGAKRRLARAQVRAEELKARKKAGRAPVAATGVQRRPASHGEPGLPVLGTASALPPASLAAIATNYLVNNRAGDGVGSGQCEVSIAARGNNLVAAWNDGQGFFPDPDVSTQGFAYSTDGGVTWTDGGIPPLPGGTGLWTSDPVITVNEKTGAFYYSALCDPTANTNGIAVVKGTFSGSNFTWGTPRVVVSANYNSAIYDKEWFVADSLTGNLYLVYTRFGVSGGQLSGNRIDLQYTALDNAFPWSSPVTLSDPNDDGLVQGSRLAVGPAGEVWSTWSTIGVNPPYTDSLRVRRISNGGAIIGAEVTAVAEFTNFGNGGPGFNRGQGFAFPGMAADRSTGPHRGRVYLTWNESVNFINDLIGNTATVVESEPNDLPATGDAFTQGNLLSGSISNINDLDYWSFFGTQGQTIICEVDATNAPTLDVAFRLFCTDASTRLAFSESGVASYGLIVFTLPVTGTYTLRCASIPPDPFTPAGTGPYVVRTGLNGAVSERGRDHRDVFTSYSDAVGTWSTPVRVNGEAAYYDDWLPEVAVAANGDPYVAWYDWRDALPGTCGGSSMVYISRSTNGGASWPDGSPVSSALSQWTSVNANIAPNQGDYISLYANQNAVYTSWSDGRNGDPDVYMAAVNLAFTAVQVSLAGTYAEPGLVRLTWVVADGAAVRATVYRRTDADDWRPLAEIFPDGTGHLTFEDRDVLPGTRYLYRLGLPDPAGETFSDEIAVDVPLVVAPALAIRSVRPNPSDREMWVAFSLATAQPARLELIDVSGRRVREQTVNGGGQQMVDLATGGRLAPGVYLVRLTQDRQSVVTRVSVVR